MLKMRVVILGSIAVWSILSCFKTIVVASTDIDLPGNATILVSKTDKSSDPLKASKGSEAMDKAKELLIRKIEKAEAKGPGHIAIAHGLATNDSEDDETIVNGVFSQLVYENGNCVRTAKKILKAMDGDIA